VANLNIFVSGRTDICRWYYNAVCPSSGNTASNLEHPIGLLNTINIALVRVNSNIYIAVLYGAPNNVSGTANVRVTSTGAISLVVEDDPNDNSGNNPLLFNSGGVMEWSWIGQMDGFVFQTTLGATVTLEHSGLTAITAMRFLNGASNNEITLATSLAAIENNLLSILVPSSFP
jgi:hypothetical protein